MIGFLGFTCLICFLAHCSSCFAVHVFLIDPNNFDPTTKIIYSSAWSSQQDYTKDLDGGILIFDGAIAENTRLEIRNLKARRIEVNATLSRGSTLLIENNQLIYGTSISRNNQINQDFGEPAGGIVVAPTIFRSSDGQYACSKMNYSGAINSNSNEVSIIIQKNYVSTLAQLATLGAATRKLIFNQVVHSGIFVYNLIICNYSTGSFEQEVFSNLIIDGNIFDLICDPSSDVFSSAGVFVYPSRRVVSATEASSLFELNVPISFLSISQNNFTIWNSSNAILIGDMFAKSPAELIIKNVSNSAVILDIGFNLFDLSTTRSGLALLNIFTFGDSSSTAFPNIFRVMEDVNNNNNINNNNGLGLMPLDLNSPSYVLHQPPKLIINFHDQIALDLKFQSYLNIISTAKLGQLANFKVSINFFNNNKILLVQVRQQPYSCNRIHLLFFDSYGDLNEMSVKNSTFQLSAVACFFYVAHFSERTRIGKIVFDSVILELLPLVYEVSSLAFENPTSTYGFFKAGDFEFIGNFSCFNNTYTESKLVLETTKVNDDATTPIVYGSLWWKKRARFYFHDFSGITNSTPIVRIASSPAFKGIRLVSITNFNFKITAAEVQVVYVPELPRMDFVRMENNFINYAGPGMAFFGKAEFRPSVLTKYCAIVCRNNTIIARNSSTLLAESQGLSNRFLAFEVNHMLLTATITNNNNNNNNDGFFPSSGITIDNNFCFARGYVGAFFLYGGYTAEGVEDENSRLVQVRDNVIDMTGVENSYFIALQPDSTLREQFQFNMKKFIIVNNRVVLKSRSSAGGIWSYYLSNGSLVEAYLKETRPVGATFIVKNNFVNLTASFYSFQIYIGSISVKYLELSNNTFLSQLNSQESLVIPVQAAAVVSPAMLQLGVGYKLASFSYATLETIYLTPSSSSLDPSRDQQTPICSTFNGKLLDEKTFKAASTGFVFPATMFYGSGVAVRIGSIQVSPVACLRARSATKTRQRRRTTSSTATKRKKRTRTKTAIQKLRNPFIRTVSQPVASALVASDVTQAIAVVSVAVLGSISSSPVLGFNVGRQQAMTNFAKKSLEGDCRGLLPATTVNEFEEHISNPLGLGDSPTQMSIGGSEKLMSYYVGAVVGDFILTFGLVLLSQGIGMAVMKYFEGKKNNNSNFGKLVRDRMGNRNKNNNKINESTFEMMRRVFATSYVSLTLFFCLSFLLTPILSSSLIVLVAAMNDPKLKDHEVGVGLKIICVILAVIFCAIAVYFVVWSVFVRKQRKEKYRILKQDGNKSQSEEKNIGAYLFKAEGEWCYPNSTALSQQNLANLVKSSKKNHPHHLPFTLWYHNFLISEPTFESYRDAIWFCSIEIISAILLAFPPFFAQFSSSGKGSCLVQGIMLLLILLVYSILLIWKNPFKLRILRIMNPVLAIQQLVIVLISLIIAATRSDNDDGESPSWVWKILIIPLAFQGAMSFLMIGAAFFPFVMFLKKLRGRMNRSTSDQTPRRNNHEMNLLSDRTRNNHRDRSNQRRPSERNHYEDKKSSRNSLHQNNSQRSQKNRERRHEEEEYSNNRQNPRIDYDDRHSRNRVSSQHDRRAVDSFSSRQLASPKSSDHYPNGNRDISPSGNTRPSSASQRDAHYSSSSRQNGSRKDLHSSHNSRLLSPDSDKSQQDRKRSTQDEFRMRQIKKIENDDTL